jgi:phosphate transporter
VAFPDHLAKIAPPSTADLPSSRRGAGLPRRSLDHQPSRASDRIADRGGRAAASRKDGRLNSDSYELSDYAQIKQRDREDLRQVEREPRRSTKRHWLEQQDEMKFSHSIQFNAVPDWSSHYIAYSNLKKLIYQLEKSVHQASAAGGDAESRPLIQSEDPEDVFTRALDVELEKISSFYGLKEHELTDEVNQLMRDVAAFMEDESDGEGPEAGLPANTNSNSKSPRQMRPRAGTGSTRSQPSIHSTESGLDDSDEDGDETTALTRKRRSSTGRRKTLPNIMQGSTDLTASTELTRSLRRFSVTMDDYAEHAVFSSGIMLKKRIISIFVQLSELKSYVQLNRTGFRKVLKKFDKIVDRQLRDKYMASVVDPAYPFRAETTAQLDEDIAKMERAYTKIVTGGDMEAAKKDLRSHLREHVVWERNTVWRDLIGIERRAEAASLGRALLGGDTGAKKTRLQGDEEHLPATKEIRTPIGRLSLPTWLFSSAMFSLVAIVAVFFALLYIPIMEKPEQQNCLAMLVFVSLLWATEVGSLIFLAQDRPWRELTFLLRQFHCSSPHCLSPSCASF